MFDSAQDYFLSIEARLLASPSVQALRVLRQECLGNAGFYRMRAILTDGSELALFEYFTVNNGSVVTEKYSFHWQTPDGQLIYRWDNAPHHSQLATAPHHVHQGSNNQVHAHTPVDVVFVLGAVESRLRP